MGPPGASFAAASLYTDSPPEMSSNFGSQPWPLPFKLNGRLTPLEKEEDAGEGVEALVDGVDVLGCGENDFDR